MIDTHTHSHHSPDGATPMLAMVEAAMDKGLTGIAFADHLEWYPGDEAYGFWDAGAYFAELSRVRETHHDHLKILASAELGNPHEFPLEVAEVLKHPFDLVIGSVHWLDGLAGWETPVFAPGLDATYQTYFEEIVKLVNGADFDVLGHLDLVRRDSWDLFGEVLPLERYRETITHILRCLIETGRGLEVNTSALRKGLSEPVPGLSALRWYRELGGEILVFGSDGHRPSDIAYGFDVARNLALAAGFRRVAAFERRQIVDWIEL
ncbi:MAG: histidinol-phosphatase HisJ family protein [Anaerolineae bacterium]|nr:histidinol-phosphatase HisJ family protein [Anaerolineae bacterium]